MSGKHKSSLFLEIDTYNTYPNKSFQQFSPEGTHNIQSSFSPTTKYNNPCDDDERIIALTQEMENMNSITNAQCITHNELNKIGSGSSANIYSISGDPHAYIKISNLPYESYMLTKTNPKEITCETIGDKLSVSLNEISNSLKYEKLSLIFPHNIMKITSAERCKKNYNGLQFFANQFLIEKIDGNTLDRAIEIMSEQELLCCLMQLLYILSYANIHGYFHNDITCNNVMIYYGDVTNIIYNKLFLFDNIILCNIYTNSTMHKIPIIKLIDFSYSEYINYKKIKEMYGKVVVGEPQQILIMIKNKLERIQSNLKNSTIFKEMCSLFDHINDGNSMLKFRYSELKAQMSSVGFRTLTDSEIIQMSISKNFAETTLLSCFDILKQTFLKSPQYGIHIQIINTSENNLPIKKILKTKLPRTENQLNADLSDFKNKYKKYAIKTNIILNEFFEGAI